MVSESKGSIVWNSVGVKEGESGEGWISDLG